MSLGSQEFVLKWQISDLYLSGLSIKKVAISLNRSHSFVRGQLKKTKTPIRLPLQFIKKYIVNDQFFKVIDKEDKAYWLGFLAADGCLHMERIIISLKLSSKDRNHIERLRRALNTNYPIHGYNKRGMKYRAYGISISSGEMYNDLMDKGVTPRKSLTLKPPKNIPNHLIHHWVRGYFDGDGCVHTYVDKRGNPKLIINVAGTKEVLGFVLEQVELDLNIKQAGNSKAFVFATSGKKAIQFYYYLYEEATICLERKKLKFEEYIIKKRKYLSRTLRNYGGIWREVNV